MPLATRLNRPGKVASVWRPAYEFGYGCLRSFVTLIFGPLFRVRRVGPPPLLPEGGVILCPNHASYLDPAFVQLCMSRRVTFVMTNDFYATWWGRWFFALVGAVAVGRGRLARRGLRRAIAHVRRGHAVVVFPEGRLSEDGKPTRAQRGVAILARRSGAPVYPVGIAGSLRAWRKGGRRPRRANVRVAFGRVPMRWEGPHTKGAQQAFANELLERIYELRDSVLEQAPHWLDAHTLQRADTPLATPDASVQNA